MFDPIQLMKSIKIDKESIELAIEYDILPYMAKRYIELFSYKGAVSLLNAFRLGLKRGIRCNTLKISCYDLLNKIKNRIIVKQTPWVPYGFWVLESNVDIGATPEYLFGYYHPQGIASMIPPIILNPEPHDKVLDMCAAPGSKTTQLAQMMENKGVILALDVDRDRMRALRSNISRLGIHNVITFLLDARKIVNVGEKFDKVLVDAPCTGEGLIPLMPERRKSRTFYDIMVLMRLQYELLKAAILVTKKEGIIVYSTCSIAPEENEVIIDSILKEFKGKIEIVDISSYGEKGFTEIYGLRLSKELEFCLRLYPHIHRTEGFFICKIKKKI